MLTLTVAEDDNKDEATAMEWSACWISPNQNSCNI